MSGAARHWWGSRTIHPVRAILNWQRWIVDRLSRWQSRAERRFHLLQHRFRRDEIWLGDFVWHRHGLGYMGMIIDIIRARDPQDEVLRFSHHNITLPRRDVTREAVARQPRKEGMGG